MARYYNHNVGSELPELFSGMKVLVQRFDDQSWEPAIIKEKCSEPRSYIVELSNGSKVRRNRRFLKEISPNASSKLCFDKSILHSNDTPVSQNVEQSAEDNTSTSEPSSPEVTFKDKANLTYVRNDVPVETAFSPRKSERTVKKPFRLIEQCEIRIKY